VRVSEGWAGQQFGAQFLPRVGQEVLVGFIDGNPERPIITGRVYNAATGVTHLPFPAKDVATKTIQKLSDLNNTARQDMLRSGIKTRSIPQPSSGKGFNLLRFDDSGGSEQVLLRSQNRLDVTALGARYETIGKDRHLTVGGKQTNPPGVAGDQITKIYRHSHLHVGDPEFPTQSGNRTTLIEQNDCIHVKQDSNQQVDGNWSTMAGGQVTIDAPGKNGTIVLNATMNISLTVGSSSIVITPSSIAITAPQVLINSSGPPPASPIDPTVDPPNEPKQADPGTSLDKPQC
jgi:type VI secretion system secreted protein VgrG